MSALAEIEDFARSVTRPETLVPAGVRVAHGDLASRFAVYRNNVAVARIGAFGDLFPVCRRLVGADFFDAAVRAHLDESPPVSPIVAEWGSDFPDWLAGFAATSGFDWLVDMARLEAAWTRAFHAAEATPMALAGLAGFAPEALLEARVALHPSLAIVSSAHPIGAIWAAHQGDGDPGPLTVSTGETVLVVRPEAEVVVAVISSADAVWLARLAAGEPLAQATEAALAIDPGFDLGARLVALASLGAVVDLA